MLLEDSKAGVTAAIVICSCTIQQPTSGNENRLLPGLHLSSQKAREQGPATNHEETIKAWLGLWSCNDWAWCPQDAHLRALAYKNDLDILRLCMSKIAMDLAFVTHAEKPCFSQHLRLWPRHRSAANYSIVKHTCIDSSIWVVVDVQLGAAISHSAIRISSTRPCECDHLAGSSLKHLIGSIRIVHLLVVGQGTRS